MYWNFGISVKLYQLRSTEAIKNQDYKIPERKKLPAKGDAFEDFVNSATSDSNDDLPFWYGRWMMWKKYGKT